MPDLKLYRDRAERGQAAGRAGGRATQGAPGRRQRAVARARGAAALVAPKALWRSHRLFTILMLLSLLPRILAARAFRPALLTADSFLYMNEAAHFTLGVIRPSGYSFLLLARRTVPQLAAGHHSPAPDGRRRGDHRLRPAALPRPARMGRHAGRGPHPVRHPPDCAGVLHPAGHAVLPRHRGGRGPAADQADTAALAVRRRRPAAGLRVHPARERPAHRDRGPGVHAHPASWLAGAGRRHPGRRHAADQLRAAFDAATGQFNTTSSDGIFLWSRTTSFANCAIIKPPRRLQPLCPDRETLVKVPPAPAVVAVVAAERADSGGLPVGAGRLVEARRRPRHQRLQRQARHAVRARCDQGPATRLPAGQRQGRGAGAAGRGPAADPRDDDLHRPAAYRRAARRLRSAISASTRTPPRTRTWSSRTPTSCSCTSSRCTSPASSSSSS